MATFTGKDGVVKLNNNTTILEVRDWSIEVSASRVDDTTMGDDWMTGKITQKSWTASVNVYWNSTQSLYPFIGDLVEIDLYPTGETTGNSYYTGSAHITSISNSASFDGMIEASLSLEGTGQLTETTV